MTTSSECVTEQTQYVEPDLTRYDAIDAVINANELQERQQLDPLMQKMFDDMKSDDAQVQYRKDMIELEHWRKKYDRILPDLEELEEQRKKKNGKGSPSRMGENATKDRTRITFWSSIHHIIRRKQFVQCANPSKIIKGSQKKSKI